MSTCKRDGCNVRFDSSTARGRPREFCSDACRVREHRRVTFLAEQANYVKCPCCGQSGDALTMKSVTRDVIRSIRRNLKLNTP